MRSIFFCFVLCFVSLAAGADPAPALEDKDCFSCHADPSVAPLVDENKFLHSVHGKASCVYCHKDVTELPHQSKPAAVNCGACHSSEMAAFIKSGHAGPLDAARDASGACSACHEPPHEILSHTSPSSRLFWQNIPATCGGCHADIMAVYNRSIHGKDVSAGKREAPVCNDCHGEHSIKAGKDPLSKVSPAHITETCAQCHSAERVTTKYRIPDFVVGSYMESYHGLSVTRGSLTTANCASCHGTHDILPDTDVDSSIYPGNLVKTCGHCHAGIGDQVSHGKIHSGTTSSSGGRAAKVVRTFYLWLIALVVGLMLLHNILDLARKMRDHYRRMAALNKPLRMAGSERAQHIVLVLTFLALAYTGFALKYPHAWWTMPFMGTDDVRGAAHRLAALLFVFLSMFHACFVLFSRKGRWHFKAMWPRLIDLVQFAQTFAYYFGLRQEKPKTAFYGYVEKMEYWALVWGSVIMVLTGGVLLRKEWFLKYFSKGILDAISTVHYYEAILACLAIVVWHWYFVMFDPDVYPMKWTWLDGKSAPADDERVQ